MSARFHVGSEMPATNRLSQLERLERLFLIRHAPMSPTQRRNRHL